MWSQPKIVTRPEQPFAAMLLTLSQPEIAATAPPLIGEVIAWIKAQGAEPTGAPFFNYVSFLPGDKMDMQVGMPTDRVLAGDAKVKTGTLPGGQYASLIHTGPYEELYEANMALDRWARDAGHDFAGTEEGGQFIGATRLEIYLKDAGEDPSGFPVTEVVFRLKY